MNYDIPVNLSDPHDRRSPAIHNEKAGDLARCLFCGENMQYIIQTLLCIYI